MPSPKLDEMTTKELMAFIEQKLGNIERGLKSGGKAGSVDITDDMVDDAIAIYEARRDMSPREAMRRVLETYLR